MGLHNMGFYDKNNLDKKVVLFEDADLSKDIKAEKVSDNIYDKMNEIIGSQFGEYHYNILCDVLKKNGIPKEKIRELRSLFGCSLRYGTLD